MSINPMPALEYLSREHGIPWTADHTGGGNWVIGIGAHHGYDEEQGTDRYDVNLGPVYREADRSFTGESGDLYAVSISPNRADITFHVADEILPALISLLGIDDVNVSDAMIDLGDIRAALGEGWSVSCLGGNIYGVTRDDGTMITMDSGASSFLPASVTIGRQAPDDEEWSELWSGQVWSADDLPAIVTDHAS